MKEPVDHIMRPQLPWRTGEGAITECGLNAASVPTITRAAFFSRRTTMGQQRTAILTCMTCSETAQRWSAWDDDPRQAMQRELTWERGFAYWHDNDRGTRLRDELLTIAALIEAHRDEFDAAMAEIEQRREWLEKKAALAAKPRAPRGRPL